MLAFFAVLLRKWKEYRLYSTTKSELGLLSNRDLNDLGINRCDIEFIAREHSKNARSIKTA
jgi:uncharacterized protein YjiS (DUF1127 family)